MVSRTERCTECYDTIMKHYLEIYFDTLELHTNFCSDCITTSFIADTAVPYATAKVNAMGMNCGSPSSATFSMDITNYFEQLGFNPITPSFTIQERDYWFSVSTWASFNPIVQSLGFHPVIFKACN